MTEKRIMSFYLDSRVEKELDARGDNRSFVIRRDLERLYTLYKQNLPQNLSQAEASLIVDVMNGIVITADTALSLWANIEDGIQLEGMAEKWHINGAALVEKLKSLNDIQALAVIDAAERFWEKHEQGEFNDIVRETFRIRG